MDNPNAASAFLGPGSKITGTVKGTVLAGYKIITTILRVRFLPFESGVTAESKT